MTGAVAVYYSKYKLFKPFSDARPAFVDGTKSEISNLQPSHSVPYGFDEGGPARNTFDVHVLLDDFHYEQQVESLFDPGEQLVLGRSSGVIGE